MCIRDRLHRHVGLELYFTSLAEEAGVVQLGLRRLLALSLIHLDLKCLDHLPEKGHHVVNLVDLLPGQDAPRAPQDVEGRVLILVPLFGNDFILVLTGEEAGIDLDVGIELNVLFFPHNFVGIINPILERVLL